MPTPLTNSRRGLLIAAAASFMLTACANAPAPAGPLPPIVFVHGNGDSAALWLTTLWRFESNGWPRERLHAVDVPYPQSRDDDTKPQPGRSGTAENAGYLSAEIDRVLRNTGAARVVLVANSRGGLTARNYIANFGGAAKVSHAVLGGTPNHGVYADPVNRLGSEFNGAGPFITALNAPKGPAGAEASPGVTWLTIRSDNNDKYAQPDGVWIGAKGTPTNVSFDGPALRGAENIVIAGIDHRETAFGPQAFAAMHRFITGREPAAAGVVAEARVVLDGMVSGYGEGNLQGAAPSNVGLAGAVVEVYATQADTGERTGAALHRKTIAADGRWGPLAVASTATLEFVLSAPGYGTTHIYRSPHRRGSNLVHLRAERVADADKAAGAVVTLTRPRGYFGVPRDRIAFDGQSPPPGVPTGVAGVSSSKIRLPDAAPRSVAAEFNGERVVGRTWPMANGEVTTLELTF